MKLIDIILLSLAAAFVIIGVHQLIVLTNNEDFTAGFTKSYWLFMLSLCLFLGYRIRKNKQEAVEKAATPSAPKTARTAKTTRKTRKAR